MKKAGRRFLEALFGVMLAAGIFAGTGGQVKAAEEPVEVISITLDMPTKVPTGDIAESEEKIKKNMTVDDSLGKSVRVAPYWYKRADGTESYIFECDGKWWKLPDSQKFVPGAEYGLVIEVVGDGGDLVWYRDIRDATIKINGEVTKFLCADVHILFKVFPIGRAGTGNSSVEATSPGEPQAPEQEHTHNYSWVTVQEASTGQDGIEEYRCSCGAVENRSIIPASSAVVKGFCDSIKNAPQNGVVQFDSGRMYTLSDRMVKALAERSDITMIVTFTYEGKTYKMTIPAGTDYTALLTDEEEFYGYFYFAKMAGAVIEEG